jgi:hypothetical protein
MKTGIVHWREDANQMTFEDFYKFHSDLFVDESEAKQIFIEIGGKPTVERKKQPKIEEKAEE